MQDFLNKVGKTASAAATKAGNKASELIEIGKLRGKINSEKRDIEAAKKEIGEYCYDMFEKDKIKDKNIKEYCERIKASEEAIDDLKRQIKEVKEEYKKETGEYPADDED